MEGITDTGIGYRGLTRIGVCLNWSDDELMLMCTMNTHQYVQMYVVQIPPLSTSRPELNTQNVNFEYTEES